MSRFGKLEFEDSSEDLAAAQPPGRPGAVRDEHYYLAAAEQAFSRRQFEPGLRLYARVLEHNANLTAAWTGQVRMLVELGEYREAHVWADKALERFPHDPDLLAAKAVSLARNGDLDGGLAYTDASLEERGDTPYVWIARGDVLLARRDALADHCIAKGLQAGRGNWLVVWMAARVRRHHGQLAAALKHLREGLATDPTAPALWLEQADCQLALGLRDAALASYSRAAELEPANEDARAGMLACEDRPLLAGLWGRLRARFSS